MKKSATFILILTLCLIFCSCGPNKTDLTVQCSCGKDYFSLPLDIKGMFEMPGTVSFSSDMSLQELKDTIDSANFGTASIQTTIHKNILSIEKTDTQAKTHVYFVYHPSDGGRMYFCDGKCLDIVIPFHFLEEQEEWRYSLLSVETETPYPTEYALEDFVAFYDKLEEYDLQTSGNTISIQLKEAYRSDRDEIRIVRLTFEDHKVLFTCEITIACEDD